MTEDEKFYRADWMSDDQWQSALLIADLFGGFHHVCGTFKPCGSGVEVNPSNSTNKFASFDFDGLTRAVVLAHDRCIRFAIEPSGPGRLRIQAHKRHKRDGSMYERHPTLEEHVAKLRAAYPSPNQDKENAG